MILGLIVFVASATLVALTPRRTAPLYTRAVRVLVQRAR